MSRSTTRASQAAVDTLHRLTAQELSRQLKAARKAKEPVSAALLTSSIAFLKLTGTHDPAPPKRQDRLKGVLPPEDQLGPTCAAPMPSTAELEQGMSPPSFK